MNSWRKMALLSILVILALFLQGSLLAAILPNALVPNLLVVILVFISFYEASVLGAILAFFLGLLLDLYGAVLLGPWSGAFVATFAFFGLMSRRMFVDSPLAVAFVSFWSFLLTHFVYLVLVFEVRPVNFGSAWQFIGKALVTAIVAPLMIAALKRILVKRERGSGGRFASIAN